MKDKFKEFFLTSWAVSNKTTVYLLTVFITLFGILSYQSIPKEQFPDIVIPTMYVSTIYPGASPKDMENLVSKPIEKEIKSIPGVKKVTSTSVQSYSAVVVEFNTDVEVAQAKQKVKDAVDKAKPDLPNDLPDDPTVQEIEFSEIPILFVNIAGDYDLAHLKHYAEMLEDRIESMKEITRVDIVGALDREIQINFDMYKMQAANVTTYDVMTAVKNENATIPGGNVRMDDMNRSLTVSGEFKNMQDIENIVIRSMSGATVYLKDIAEVKDGFADQESYARLDHKNVITLNVIKRTGMNLIESSDKIKEIIEEMKKTEFPDELSIEVTGDQSRQTRVTLHDLINTIIIGFILVTIILMFFMGVTNAIFVALSVPLSMFIAFLILPGIGFTMNMIVLFAFLLGLGIVVDDAIVVIENTHRIYDNGKVPIKEAAKRAAGEIFLPVLSGTATTLAPFVPLAFWSGVIGKFMRYLPVTLIITLTASLVVAYIINPVFAVDFMQHEGEVDKRKKRKRMMIVSVVIIALALLFYLAGSFGMGNFMVTCELIYLFYSFVLEKLIYRFQHNTWPRIQARYARFLEWALQRPRTVFWSTFALLIFVLVLTFARQPKVVFFPKAEPNFIYVYATLPVGSSPEASDSVARIVEDRVYSVIGENNPIVESVITNVAVGANESREDRTPYSHKAKVGVGFVEFGQRKGESTAAYLDKIREATKGIPGVEIAVDQEQSGPPTAKPVSIEITGEKFEDLITASVDLKHYLDSLSIPGVEEIKSDLQLNKPEILVEINRERANREGISTAQIGGEINLAVLGREVSRFRDENDDYPIKLRYQVDQRKSIEALKNLQITYRDMNMGGMIRQVPLSSFADVKYTSTYSGINRKNHKRVVTLSSNVLSGFNENQVAAEVKAAAALYTNIPDGVTVNLAGQAEEQAETGAFLGTALGISLMLILLILVTQFNSIGRTVIILSEIIFSVIGVLLGQAIFGMDFSIVMTGVGIVALAGIVVRNGILLVEFTDILRERGHNLHDAITEAGRVRMTPVLLTATATILGMIPLAIGFNIDFVTMFTELDPKIFFGGDSVAFWGPLAWTIVFGLAFATFITLILVPVMYEMSEQTKARLNRALKKGKKDNAHEATTH
ncbi:MAG: efflux RND transporter permease subunit [Flavobacteriales bacterium]|nr:efflux RND transporter permease subunit [Flavobacteriales bacterium]